MPLPSTRVRRRVAIPKPGVVVRRIVDGTAAVCRPTPGNQGAVKWTDENGHDHWLLFSCPEAAQDLQRLIARYLDHVASVAAMNRRQNFHVVTTDEPPAVQVPG